MLPDGRPLSDFNGEHIRCVNPVIIECIQAVRFDLPPRFPELAHQRPRRDLPRQVPGGMDPHRALVRVPASGHLRATGSPGRYGEAFPQGRALDGQGQGRHFALAHVQLAVGRESFELPGWDLARSSVLESHSGHAHSPPGIASAGQHSTSERASAAPSRAGSGPSIGQASRRRQVGAGRGSLSGHRPPPQFANQDR